MLIECAPENITVNICRIPSLYIVIFKINSFINYENMLLNLNY